MLTVFPYSAKDQDQAVRLAEWIRELGQNKSHRVLIVRDRRCDLEHDKSILAALEQSFAAVETLTVNDDAYDSWPESANTMFRNAAKHIEFTKKEPFLWLEPDTAPIKEGWLDAIAAEYASCGKPFMGDRVEVENVPLHMSGVACYPGVMSNYAGLAYLAQDIAWDCAAAAQIVPQAHFTNLIEHAWKHPTFESWEQVEREVSKEAVLYHASKDGSLIRLLRAQRNLPVPVLAESESRDHVTDRMVGELPPMSVIKPEGRTTKDKREGSNEGHEYSREPRGGQFICDIFIKTYPPDYPWLEYCLRSIDKFATGFRNVVVVTSEGGDCPKATELFYRARPDAHGFRYVVFNRPEHGPDGYLSQQVFKLYADTLTDAAHILFTDSDTIFVQPVTPETYFTDGRVNWMITPYSKTDTPWKPMIEKFLGRPVEFETMRRHPQMVPRWLLIAMREFCEKQHGMPLDQYVMSQPYREFSEFNALGAFAYYWHNDKFNWINTATRPEQFWPELTVLQKYSHGGLTPEIVAEFEAILSGDVSTVVSAGCESKSLEVAKGRTSDPTPCEDSAPPAQTLSATNANGAPLLATLPQQVPWESKEQSLEEIRSLAKRLKNFCGKASHVRAVRLELHKLGVIELPYRFRKRKGKWRSKVKK